jgi:hypothetical protein
MVLHLSDSPLTDAADISRSLSEPQSRLHRGLEALRETMSQESDKPSRAEERPA